MIRRNCQNLNRISDQYEFRKKIILEELKDSHIDIEDY